MLGCDIINVERIQKLATNKSFLKKCFTEDEISYFDKYRDGAPIIAGHFAAKEAVAKALGCGFGAQLDFLDFSVAHDAKGRPFIKWHPAPQRQRPSFSQNRQTDVSSPKGVHAGLSEFASALTSPITWQGHNLKCAISISHERAFAMATALIV